MYDLTRNLLDLTRADLTHSTNHLLHKGPTVEFGYIKRYQMFGA